MGQVGAVWGSLVQYGIDGEIRLKAGAHRGQLGAVRGITGQVGAVTSTLLPAELMKLNPGILFSLQTTPTSSVCLQSDTPSPLWGQRARDVSCPLQWTLSNQIRPANGRTASQRTRYCLANQGGFSFSYKSETRTLLAVESDPVNHRTAHCSM